MAMNLNLEEEEQVDAFKRIWTTWGVWILGVAAIVVLVFVGWNYYKYYMRESSIKAAILYDALSDAIAKKDTGFAQRAMADMIGTYPRTVYAQQAGLLMAKYEFELGKKSESIQDLTWVSERTADKSLADVARLRMAGVLLQQSNTKKAIELLMQPFSPAFAGLVADRLGDAYSQQGNKTLAKDSYIAAYQDMAGQNLPYQKLIAVKLNALGVDTTNLVAIH